jgi:hypothetical protein
MKTDSNQTDIFGSVRKVFSVGFEIALLISEMEVEVNLGRCQFASVGKAECIEDMPIVETKACGG